MQLMQHLCNVLSALMLYGYYSLPSAGSFGSVFKAMHPETGLVIAVKEVYIDVQRTPDEKLKALK